ncbi:hypothetical protein [Streptomyces sp. NBC_01565]|uniref:hypothetical protein n=1 Tax=unclassified Streptomyces TaxID=2593676 RepID=UPI00224E46EF|nr:hypothetical protein [Streptomyces sp. NBC_01565]
MAPVPNVWVTVRSFDASPVVSLRTSFLRLPSRSYSYFCQYGDGPPTLGFPEPSTAGPSPWAQPPMPRTLG